MKTAMQELYADLEKFKSISDTISIVGIQRMIGHYANEKEKQQIIEAHSQGIYDCLSGQQYYNETFK